MQLNSTLKIILKALTKIMKILYNRIDINEYITPPTAGVVYMSKSGIKPYGAGFDIKINKEVVRMLNLHAYIDELVAKKNEVLAQNNDAEINAKVEEYRNTLIREAEEAKAAAVAKIDSDIDCVNTLIARENEIEVKEGE